MDIRGFPCVTTSLRMVVDSSLTVVMRGNVDPPADSHIGLRLTGLVAEKAKRSGDASGDTVARTSAIVASMALK